MRLTAAERRARERYQPCVDGIHVCGADHDGNEFFTEANFFGADRETFDLVKAECVTTEGEPTDFVVDFIVGGTNATSVQVGHAGITVTALALATNSVLGSGTKGVCYGAVQVDVTGLTAVSLPTSAQLIVLIGATTGKTFTAREW